MGNFKMLSPIVIRCHAVASGNFSRRIADLIMLRVSPIMHYAFLNYALPCVSPIQHSASSIRVSMRIVTSKGEACRRGDWLRR